MIIKRKQIKYKQLSEEIENLKKLLKESEAEVTKWKDAEFKNKNVKTRIEELLNQSEKFRWN